MAMVFYTASVETALKELATSRQGLQPTVIDELQKMHGKNVLRVKGEPLWRKLLAPFIDVFMLVLAVAAVLSLLHGDTLDAFIVIGIMAANAIIYYIQRFSTDRILRSLQKHSAQAVTVVRGGKSRKVDSTELVPGDIIVLTEGEKVPADARLIEGSDVRVDESLLTGESVPISKTTDALRGEKEVYEQKNMLFQGSFVVAGVATAVVCATGNTTQFGQLAALSTKTDTRNPVQKKIDTLIKQIISVVLAISVVAFVLAIVRGTELTEAIRFVMALAVSAVPEGLPVAISVILVLGMRRMAARKALVRNMRAIETIGAITTIATDKTGTLTKNKLTVQETWQPNTIKKSAFDQLVARSVTQTDAAASHDPLDTAMNEYVAAEKISHRNVPLRSLAFHQAFAMSGNVWHKGGDYELVVKGAPEHVLNRSKLTKKERETAETALQNLTAQGYRVIAVAEATLSADLTSFDALPRGTKLRFAGFLAVADILRPEASKAIRAALDAGVTVRMITGDHFETAYHIGKKLGMANDRSQVFDSRLMTDMSDEELEKAVADVRVFSRVVPENKYRLLSILKKNNITAMTGDGVNDVPALSNAHIGVAMGSGSQIAKDAGDIVLLDDNFKSIIDAMREGRTIISNIRRMLYYLLATNTGEVLTMLGALIIGMPVPLAPVQILWINLVTDTSIVIPLGLEKGQKNSMKQKPARPNAPILSRFLIWRMALVALSMAITTLALYIIFSGMYGAEYGRTIAFSSLVTMQWANALNARSDYESIITRMRVWSWPLFWGLSLAIFLQGLAIFGPLQDVLRVSPVALSDLALTGSIAFIIPIVCVELHKWYGRRTHMRVD